MSHSQIVCAYSVTAVGNIAIASLRAQLAAVPLDTSVPQFAGLQPVSDVTTFSGQTATRTITLKTGSFYSTASGFQLASGQPGGSPLLNFTLPGGSPANYPVQPVPAIVDPGSTAAAGGGVAITMGLGTVAFLSGGTGYTLATKLTAPTPPGGKAAVLVVDSISGGVIVGITVSDPGFGYTTYVPIQVTDTGGGTGAVLSAALQVVSAKVVAPGKGYFTPRFTLTPQFQSSFPDPNSSQSSTVQAAVTATQASSVTGWMRHKLTQALQSPITETAPVVS